MRSAYAQTRPTSQHGRLGIHSSPRGSRLSVGARLCALTLSLLIVGVLTCTPEAHAVSYADLSTYWHTRTNTLRSIGGLPPVSNNLTWGSGCWLHARYMAENRVIGHTENPSLPYYTAEGALAASKSNCSVGRGGVSAIDGWMATPFHGIAMIDPQLSSVGFGTYTSSAGVSAAALDVKRGVGPAPSGVSFPIMWPGAGQEVPFRVYGGGEYPDPLAGSGYAMPTGLPIMLQVGVGSANPTVAASRIWVDGYEIDHLVFSETSYRNPSASAQATGRSILAARDAIVLMPREPLLPGTRYDVSVRCTNGATYSWWFTTSADAAPYVPRTIAVEDIEGADRYKTSVEASRRAFPDGASAVVIATGVDWPDALGGAALAGAVDGPLLLTSRDEIPGAVLAEIDRLGATDAYILGGEGAVESPVEQELARRLKGQVTRLAGTDRYDTATRIAKTVIALQGAAYSGEAYVATGADFPDALGASPRATAQSIPIILSRRGARPALPEGVSSATILGGSAAVTRATEDALRAQLGGGNVTRIAGADRYETAERIAEHSVENGLDWDGVAVASGQSFPDALSGGVMQGHRGSAMLLTTGGYLAQPTDSCLYACRDLVSTLRFIGGDGAVSPATRYQARVTLLVGQQGGSVGPPVIYIGGE